MKPGSSSRCKDGKGIEVPKKSARTGWLRCNRTQGHDGQHQARQGETVVRW